MGNEKRKPAGLDVWKEARKRYRLSHTQIQMARELGLNPRKFGGLANHRQEPWKMPLPDFIEHLYRKRHNKDRPDRVRSIEEIIARKEMRTAERRKRRLARKAAEASPAPDDTIPF